MTDHFTAAAPEPPLYTAPHGLGAFRRGELSLPRTYWLWGVGVSLLIALPVGFFIGMLKVAETPAAVVFLPVLAMVAWNWLVVMAVWRSAAHYQGPKVWAILARVFVSLGFGSNLIQFIQLAMPDSL